MKKKNYLILDEEFLKYCQLNDIDNIDKVAKETFNRGFAILKYGETLYSLKKQETINEKEVVKEIIKEVEVIKEVPVEKIVEVVKQVNVPVNNDEEISRLTQENNRLKDDLNKITKTLESLNKASFMKNSNLNSLYGE